MIVIKSTIAQSVHLERKLDDPYQVRRWHFGTAAAVTVSRAAAFLSKQVGDADMVGIQERGGAGQQDVQSHWILLFVLLALLATVHACCVQIDVVGAVCGPLRRLLAVTVVKYIVIMDIIYITEVKIKFFF
jgi:hypothetical protein